MTDYKITPNELQVGPWHDEAGELMRVSKENERLRTALKEISDYKVPPDVTGETGLAWVQIIAARALGLLFFASEKP